MKRLFSIVLSWMASWRNQTDAGAETEFPSFVNKVLFLYGGRS
jgi:hypothetical protein